MKSTGVAAAAVGVSDVVDAEPDEEKRVTPLPWQTLC